MGRRRTETDRQTDREDGRTNYDLFLYQLSGYVWWGWGVVVVEGLDRQA